MSKQIIQEQISKYSNELNIIISDKLTDNLLEIEIPEQDNTNVDKFIKLITDMAFEFYSQYNLNLRINIYDNVNDQEINI